MEKQYEVPMVNITLQDGTVLNNCHIYREFGETLSNGKFVEFLVVDNKPLIAILFTVSEKIHYQTPTLQGHIPLENIKSYSFC